MRLKLVEFDWEVSEHVSLGDLRLWIIKQISCHGEPLRWAITEIKAPDDYHLLGVLRIEAVVIQK